MCVCLLTVLNAESSHVSNGCLRLLRCWLRRLSLLCNTPSIYRPLMIYNVYIAVGQRQTDTHTHRQTHTERHRQTSCTHTHTLLSPTSITWYRSQRSDILVWEGNRRSGFTLAMHCRLEWFIDSGKMLQVVLTFKTDIL